MKQLAFVLVILTVSTAYAQETFVFSESYRTFTDDSANQTTVVWAERDMNERTGLFGWAQFGKSYNQGYGGAFLKLTSWLKAGVGAGVEQADNIGRVGTYAFAAKDGHSLYALYENGGSGYWYLVTTTHDVGPHFNFGFHSQAFVGHGIRMEFKLPSFGGWTPSIRPTMLWETEQDEGPNFILGFRMTYFKGD